MGNIQDIMDNSKSNNNNATNNHIIIVIGILIISSSFNNSSKHNNIIIKARGLAEAVGRAAAHRARIVLASNNNK